MLESQSTINNAVPKLKTGLRIAPFHDGGAVGERYLVEVGETCFVAGKSMRDVLVALGDEPKTLEELAATYERQTGKSISTEVLGDVLAHRISDSLFDHTPDPKNKRPFIFSFNFISEDRVRPYATAFAFLFAKPIVLLVSACFLLAEFLIFTQSLSAIQRSFQLRDLLLFYVFIIGVALFHELGHAAACRRFDCPHGSIGFALYFIYPCFYTDVTKVWRLPSLKRAVVDLGGIYFQAILFVILTIYVLLTNDVLVLRLLWVMNFTMFLTLNPIFKMDGYWLLTDLSGLSNLHGQMRDTAVNIGRKLFGRPAIAVAAPQAQGFRRKVLYVYIVLAFLYFAFIAQFLYQSAGNVLNNYPQRAPYLIEIIQTAYLAGDTQRALGHAATLVYESVWPLILSVLVGLMVYRLVRFIYRTIRSVMSGYTVTISMPRWVYAIDNTVSAWKARWARHG